MNDLQRIVEIEPAFDKRSADPKKNYGIHGCNLRMVLKGPDGAVQFLLYTNWQLPHVAKEQDMKILSKAGLLDYVDLHVTYHPMPADLGYHSRKPQFEDQKSMGPCEYCDGADCYYDGSGLNAEPVYLKLLEGGSDAVWKELENFYRSIFEELPHD